ncbi:hypothetical protein [Rhizobium etli]|uniref:hypothetical protein n=1 Tax=Rhizobium etli TaxID=29449 RepID=UPI0012BB95D1|nr:hypothetical protein [Rhizobium etli]
MIASIFFMRKCLSASPVVAGMFPLADMMQISCQFEIRLIEKRRQFCRNRRVCGQFNVDLVKREVEKYRHRRKIGRKLKKSGFPAIAKAGCEMIKR